MDDIFNRWFNKDKSFKASELKKLYPDHYDDVKSDKFPKQYIQKVMDPLDNLFLSIGNELIDLLDGFTNKNEHDKTIDTLSDYNLYLNVIPLKRNNNDKDKLELINFYSKFGFVKYKGNICITTMIRISNK